MTQPKTYPNIPIVFEDKVPKNFVNDLKGWSFSRERVEKEQGRLLALDIDFGEYCSLNCQMCFRKSGNIDKTNANLNMLNFDDTIDIIKQGIDLGLESVRILGAGEPLENPKTLKLIYESKQLGIKDFILFTQAHVIGDDNLVRKIYPELRTGEDLAKKLKDLGVSLMIRYDSFIPEIQELSTGTKGIKKLKDNALEILVKEGFNNCNPTKLGIVAPLTEYLSKGILEVYEFFRKRNIYPLIPFVACAGRSKNKDGTIKGDISTEEKSSIVHGIYETNKKLGIGFEGVSAYPGTHICTFLSTGIYITSRGEAYVCEGNDEAGYRIGNIREKSLKDLWENSLNRKAYSGRYNYGCPPKAGLSIPCGFLRSMEEKLKTLPKPL